MTTVKDGFNNAVDFVKGLASDAWNWGSDIISGIIDSIKSMIGSLADCVTGVADTIREFLHFFVPDKGPADRLRKLDAGLHAWSCGRH